MTDLDQAAAHRAREWFHTLTVPDGLTIIVRVDGRGFSKLTEGNFTKPWSDLFANHMKAVAEALMTELGGVFGYTFSDEISILLPARFDLFGRGLEKLVSISAGIASQTFTAADVPGHFDARLWVGAQHDAPSYFTWRQADALRNSLNDTCYWTLRNSGMPAGKATSLMKGATRAEKRELLHQHGVNWNDLPASRKCGSGVMWEMYLKQGFNPVTEQTVPALRKRLRWYHDMPEGDACADLVRVPLAAEVERGVPDTTTDHDDQQPTTRKDQP